MTFEVRTSDFSMPQQGRVDVYVNEVKAFGGLTAEWASGQHKIA